MEENSKIINQIKAIMLGDEEHSAGSEATCQMFNEFYMNDLLFLTLSSLPIIDFETRKDVSNVIIALVKKQFGSRFTTIDFICSHLYILEYLLTSYEKGEIAINCGMILRECFKFDPLVQATFQNEKFWNLFSYAKISEFNISSDAFASLCDLLIRNKALSCAFIMKNYEKFIMEFGLLLDNDNYILKRQSLKLINELIADRSCYDFMIQYVSSASNLKLIMNCLKDKSKNIQFEAYHIFKLFAFNPEKPEQVNSILFKNKEKLVEFLDSFTLEKGENDEFAMEKQSLVQEIQNLTMAQDVSESNASGSVDFSLEG